MLKNDWVKLAESYDQLKKENTTLRGDMAAAWAANAELKAEVRRLTADIETLLSMK